MCAEYSSASLAQIAVSTEHILTEVIPASGVSIGIKRITLGNTSTHADNVIRLRLYRCSTAGSGGVSSTVQNIKGGLASTCALNVKTGATAFTLGTVVDKVIDIAHNARTTFHWIARDRKDIIWSEPGLPVALTGTITTTLITSDNRIYWVE